MGSTRKGGVIANISNWKNLERLAAAALGGKRRLRTMESYGKPATDIWWPKSERKKFPFLKWIKVECKKRRSVNFAKEFAVAKVKYGRHTLDKIVLVSKVPATKSWKVTRDKLAKKFKLSVEEIKSLKRGSYIAPLVTVELGFFAEIFDAWKESDVHGKRDKQDRFLKADGGV